MFGQILKVVERLSRHEELCVVLVEARTVFLNLEASPGVLRTLCHLSFLSILSTTATHNASLVSLTALLALLLALVMSLSFDELLSPLEVDLDFLVGWDSSLCGNPRVLQNLLHRGSVGRVESHHLLKEVFELR